MKVAAYLLGDSGRMPFVGHFRTAVSGDDVCLAAAGRIAAGSGITTAFRAARQIESALHGIQVNGVKDRNALLRSAWSVIADIAEGDLGPDGGADLSVIFACADNAGVGIAGTGLGGVWSWEDNALQPLVMDDHPLLGPPGRPAEVPGVLTLDTPLNHLVAIPHPLQMSLPSSDQIAPRCGVHP